MPDDDDEIVDDPGQSWPVLPGDVGEASTPWVWVAMDPPERRARMRELAAWVAWLMGEHALHNAIPPCWYRHPPVREHLTALYAGWVRIFCAEDDGGRELREADWLTTLHNFVPYLQSPACLSGGHQDPPPRPSPDSDTSDDLATYLWTSDFGTQPAQHPAPEAALRMQFADE